MSDMTNPSSCDCPDGFCFATCGFDPGDKACQDDGYAEMARDAEKSRDEARKARREAAASAKRTEELLARMEKRLERIEGATRAHPKATGEAVGRAVNSAVSNGRRIDENTLTGRLPRIDAAVAALGPNLAPRPSGRAFIRTRLVWLAWYPLRGRRCSFIPARRPDGWHLAIGLGPLWLGLGPGTPAV